MKELKDKIIAARAELARAKQVVAALEGEAELSIRPQMPNNFGVKHIEVDGVAVKLTVPKTVKWDQEMLAGIFRDILASGDDPLQYIKVSYDVSEVAYNNWPDGIREVFEPARTTKAGKVKIEFEGEEDE